jgi:hypothetical protein
MLILILCIAPLLILALSAIANRQSDKRHAANLAIASAHFLAQPTLQHRLDADLVRVFSTWPAAR